MKCDVCGTSIVLEAPRSRMRLSGALGHPEDWIYLEFTDREAQPFHQRFDFCSWSCLAKFVRSRGRK